MRTTGFKRVLFAVIAAMGLTASAVNGVKYFDSIEALSGQAIDTGIAANGSIEVECEMEWLCVPTDGSFLGAREIRGNRVYVIYSYEKWSMGYGDNIYGTVDIEPNKKYHVVSTVNKDVRRCVVDGVEVLRDEGAKTISNNCHLYLFDFCNGGAVGGVSSQTRLYWMKIRKLNESTGTMELVRDFRPAKKDNRYGLYDAVSGRLFAAIPASGAFGPDSVLPQQTSEAVTYFDCLDTGTRSSDSKVGFQAIDTEVIGRDGIQVEGEIAWNADFGDNCFVGSRKDSTATRCYAIYSYNAWSMANGENIKGAVKYTPGQKYHVVSTITNGVSTCVVDGKEVLRDESGRIIDTGRNLYIFDINCGGYTDADVIHGRVCHGDGRIWWLKIRELDKTTGEFKLVRDFRPAYKDGEYGLYDAVSKRLFTALPGAPRFSRENMMEQSMTPIPAPRPKNYLEFLELSGGAVVDTGVRARSGLETEVDFTPYADPSCAEAYMLGTLSNKLGPAHMIKHCYRYGDDIVSPTVSTINNPLRGKRKRIRTHLFAGEQWIEVNGVRTAQGTAAEAIDAGDNLLLFGRDMLPTTDTMPSSSFCGRFYGCRIWEQDGTDGLKLVRDFRPCLYDADMAGRGEMPALYDEVSQAYFPIRMASTFTDRLLMPRFAAPVPGPRVMAGPQRRVEYLESDGANCIFTGVQGKNDLKVEAEVAWLAYLGDAGLLATRGDGDSRCYLLYSDGDNKWIHCWNTWNVNTAKTVPIELEKVCKVSATYEDGLQQLVVDGDEVVNRTVTGKGGSTMDLSLFGLNRYFTAPTPFVKARVYTLKIWARDPEKGETEYRLVRDYVPCVNDGVPGLYDRVTGHLACEEKNLGCVGANGVVPGPTMKAGPYKPMGLVILLN